MKAGGTFIVAVTGGRDHLITEGEVQEFRAELDALRDRHSGRPLVVIHGNNPNEEGVDKTAARLAESWGFPAVPYEAPWEFKLRRWKSGGLIVAGSNPPSPGPSAGPLRNWMMIQASHRLLAFPGGNGTAGCVRMAKTLCVEVVEIGRAVQSTL